MQKNKLIRIVESFILFPIITMSGSFGGVLPQAGSGIVSTSQFVLSQKFNIESESLLAYNRALDEKTQILKIKAEAIDTYFRERNMPLVGMGMKMVEEAEKNNLDWRLLAAISVRESTGGKFDCIKVPNNPFGWGSCKIGFESINEAIETLGRNLGGANPRTANHYADKTTIQILRAYNPPSIIPRYAEQVISIMNKIGAEEIVITPEPAILAEVIS